MARCRRHSNDVNVQQPVDRTTKSVAFYRLYNVLHRCCMLAERMCAAKCAMMQRGSELS